MMVEVASSSTGRLERPSGDKLPPLARPGRRWQDHASESKRFDPHSLSPTPPNDLHHRSEAAAAAASALLGRPAKSGSSCAPIAEAPQEWPKGKEGDFAELYVRSDSNSTVSPSASEVDMMSFAPSSAPPSLPNSRRGSTGSAVAVLPAVGPTTSTYERPPDHFVEEKLQVWFDLIAKGKTEVALSDFMAGMRQYRPLQVTLCSSVGILLSQEELSVLLRLKNPGHLPRPLTVEQRSVALLQERRRLQGLFTMIVTNRRRNEWSEEAKRAAIDWPSFRTFFNGRKMLMLWNSGDLAAQGALVSV